MTHSSQDDSANLICPLITEQEDGAGGLPVVLMAGVEMQDWPTGSGG